MLLCYHYTTAQSITAADINLMTCILQLSYFVCANALNNLLLRKEMCHWTKGMQIRYVLCGDNLLLNAN